MGGAIWHFGPPLFGHGGGPWPLGPPPIYAYVEELLMKSGHVSEKFKKQELHIHHNLPRRVSAICCWFWVKLIFITNKYENSYFLDSLKNVIMSKRKIVGHFFLVISLSEKKSFFVICVIPHYIVFRYTFLRSIYLSKFMHLSKFVM